MAIDFTLFLVPVDSMYVEAEGFEMVLKQIREARSRGCVILKLLIHFVWWLLM